MRSIWKGHIRFSLVTIPIRVYNAIETSQKISFNQLHKECHGQVGYDKRCKKCNQIVALNDIVKGYQYEPGQYVVVDPADLEKIKLKTTKIIEVTGFVDASEIHPMLYESPYFAGPDGTVAEQSYALLREALRQTNRVAIGKVVLRDREDAVVISPHEDGLVLYRLRYPNELRKIGEVPQVNGNLKLEDSALQLARNLVDTLTMPFDQVQDRIKDQYGDALRELIQDKLEGKEIVAMEEQEAPVVDIMAALKASIEQAKAQRKPMTKAAGKAAQKAAAEETQAAEEEKKPLKARKRKVA